MDVLVACEFSGKVRDAFINQGHNAWSCDIVDTDKPGNHIKGNVLKYLNNDWDVLIAFIPCTYLCFAGIRWNVNNLKRQQETIKAIEFFKTIWNAPINKIAIENPVGVIPKHTGVKWSQMIHPWQFGHEEEKRTCLWLKNLPLLKPTRIMDKREQRVFKMSPSKNRSKLRSVTFNGVADAMASQWG